MLYIKECTTPDFADMSLRKQNTLSISTVDLSTVSIEAKTVLCSAANKEKKWTTALQEFLIFRVLSPATQGIMFCIVLEQAVFYFFHCLLCAYLWLALLLYTCIKNWEGYFNHLCLLFTKCTFPHFFCTNFFMFVLSISNHKVFPIQFEINLHWWVFQKGEISAF